MKPNKISLSEYWSMLNKCDWYYNHSDSQNVFKIGQLWMNRLVSISKHGEKYQELFDGFCDHKYSDQPKPERPEEK